MNFTAFFRIIIIDKTENEYLIIERNMKMAKILPVSDLRNYNEVLKNCRSGEPVFLTKNGRGRFVVLDIEDYERAQSEKKLLKKLQEAEESVKNDENWLTLDSLKKSMEK